MTVALSHLISLYGSVAIFLLMTLESACIPIPSEVVVPYGGYLASSHLLTLTSVIIAATAANVTGGLIAYAVGRSGGRRAILRFGKYIFLNQRHLDRAETWFRRRGEITVFVCRLLPVLRTFISLPAGIAKMPLGKFVLYSTLGSLPWNAALAYAGFQLGEHWGTVSIYMKPLTYLGAVLFLIAILWAWLGRRKLGAKHAS